jgi:ribosomal protein S18 acetylase RimI-like enzyme
MSAVREAVEADLPRIGALFEALDAHHAALHPAVFRPLDAPARSDDALRAVLHDPDQAILVTDGAVGMCHVLVRRASFPVHRPAPWLLIDTLHVEVAHRRRGHARALMEAALAWGRSRDLVRAEVGVWAGNTGAEALYAALGFTTMRRQLGMPL